MLKEGKKERSAKTWKVMLVLLVGAGIFLAVSPAAGDDEFLVMVLVLVLVVADRGTRGAPSPHQ